MLSSEWSSRAPTTAFLDHHQSLVVWDAIWVRDARVVHVDTHCPVYAMHSSAIVQPKGVREPTVQFGDYLFHALREGIVGAVLQVVPDTLQILDARRDLLRSCPPEIWSRVTLCRLEHLPDAFADLGWTPPLLVTTVAASPGWLPPHTLHEADAALRGLGVGAAERRRLRRAASARRQARTTVGPLWSYAFPYDAVMAP